MKNKSIALLLSAILLVMALAVSIQPAYGYGGIMSSTGQVHSPHGVPAIPSMHNVPAVPHFPSFHWPYGSVTTSQT